LPLGPHGFASLDPLVGAQPPIAIDIETIEDRLTNLGPGRGRCLLILRHCKRGNQQQGGTDGAGQNDFHHKAPVWDRG